MGNPRVQYASLRFILCAIALLVVAGVVRADQPTPIAPKPEVPPVRIAILNFGPPADEPKKGTPCDMVGACIDVEDWREVIAMLEKDKAEIVVLTVNSTGGHVEAVQPFHDLFEKEYKPRFRTVAWIDQCVFNTALAVLPIEEYYFKPKGVFGWGLIHEGPARPEERRARLEQQTRLAETGSRLGRRDPVIARSWLLFQPLSADIDPKSGVVTWRQDELGQVLVNKEGMVFTFGADLALRTRFSRATASTQQELAAALGLAKVEWVGKEAADFLKRRLEERSQKYDEATAAYSNLMQDTRAAETATDPTIARQYAARALKHLQALEALAENSPRMIALTVGERSVLEHYRARIKNLQTR